jgi:serine/threonine protein kinase
MGAVFLAREESLERLVAIKVLPPGRENDGESRERFRREAKMAARLTHPNIVPLLGFGEVDGMMYLAMGDHMTRTGLIVGTPLYMSPEQARGEDLDGRSDLYSLGAVGYAMLSGRAPFEGGTPQQAIVKRLTQDVPPLKAAGPELPTDLAGGRRRALWTRHAASRQRSPKSISSCSA